MDYMVEFVAVDVINCGIVVVLKSVRIVVSFEDNSVKLEAFVLVSNCMPGVKIHRNMC